MKVKNKRKADASNIGIQKTTELVQIYQAFFEFDNNKNNRTGQCIRCKSDYMKYAIKGYCQNCIQRCEFISREYPQVLEKVSEVQV